MKNFLSVFTVAVIVLASIGATSQAAAPVDHTIQVPLRSLEDDINAVIDRRKVPIAISGDNTYIVWWSNRTGNDEVMFRASTDGGTTFADKINLSNSTNADSQNVKIAADGDNVIITWWERNATSEEPVARISSDNGATFGPLLRLATSGTVGIS